MYIIIDLLLTLVIYLAFPAFYRYLYGKVDKKKGTKLALFNSLICAVIFMVIRGVLYGSEYTVGSFAPAVLYFFIAQWILVDKNIVVEQKTNNNIKDNKDPTHLSNKNERDFEDVNAEEELFYQCKECGCQVHEEYKCCPNCGIELDFLKINQSFDRSCKNCGAEIEDTFAFCVQCGEAIKKKESNK